MRLALAGDVMLGRLVNDALRTGAIQSVWGDVLPSLRECDGFVLNLECVLSSRGEPWPRKVFTFRSEPGHLRVLEEAGVSAVNLANNHSLDYGPDALEDCLRLLKQRDIAVCGAGRDEAEASAGTSFGCGALQIGVLGFTDNEPEWSATPEFPGTFYAPIDPEDPRFERVLERVAELSRANDLLIVSVHWGGNWGDAPPDSHRRAARRLIEAGADLIHGHSPHVFRGIELFRGRPILYSCGDFIDDYSVDEVDRNDCSFLFQLDYSGTTLKRIELLPTVIEHFTAHRAFGFDRQQSVRRMVERCRELGTDSLELTQEGLSVFPPLHEATSVPTP